MTTRNNNDGKKLVNLAVELDQQLKRKQLESPQDRRLQLPPDEMVDLSDDQVGELNEASDALSFLDQVRADMLDLGFLGNESNVLERMPDDVDGTTSDRSIGSKSAELDSRHEFGRFKIIEPIGEGGFARVFRAYDPSLNRDVALKIPRPHVLSSPESQKRFVREGKAAAILSHPAIVAVFEAGAMGPINYIASAYCPGETLADWFSNQPEDLNVRTAAKIVTRLAEAVHHAHQRGVVHRDLKPANILVEEGETELADRIRITDFGLAKQLASDDATLTIDGAVVGTPVYMSPEQVRCDPEIGVASDIYSLGVILYELLTGIPPHKKSGISATIRAVEFDPITPIKTKRAGVPAELAAICQKCLEKEPTQRYATAFDLADDLDRFQNGQPVTAKHPSPLDRLTKWARRNPAVAACLTVTILTLVTGVATSWSMYKKSERDRIDAVNAKNEAIDLRKSESEALVLANTRLTEMNDQMDLLTNIFEEISPSSKGAVNDKVLVEQLGENLVLASERIFESNADPALRSKMASRLGFSLANIGFGKEAVDVTTRALALAKDKQIPESELLSIRLYAALTRHTDQDFETVTKELGSFIDSVIDSDAIGYRAKLGALSLLADSYFNSGRRVKSAKTYRRLIQLMDRLRAEQSTASLNKSTTSLRSEWNLLNNRQIQRYYVYSGYRIATVEYELDPSESNLNELIKSHEGVAAKLGPEDISTIASATELAMALGQNRRINEALELADETYQNSAKAFGKEAWSTLNVINAQIVVCGTNMGNSECRKRLPEFLVVGREACQAHAKSFGEDNPRVISVYGNVATGFGLTGDLDSCIEIRRDLLAISERKNGRDNIFTQNQIQGLGVALAEAGEHEEARKLLEEYLEFAKTSVSAEATNIECAKRSLKSIQKPSH